MGTQTSAAAAFSYDAPVVSGCACQRRACAPAFANASPPAALRPATVRLSAATSWQWPAPTSAPGTRRPSPRPDPLAHERLVSVCSALVTIGGQTCGFPLGAFRNASLLQCTMPAGQGVGAQVVVSVANQASNNPVTFNYDAPTIGSVTCVPPPRARACALAAEQRADGTARRPSNGPAAGRIAITLQGSRHAACPPRTVCPSRSPRTRSFGVSGTVSVGGTPCSPVSYAHRCLLPAAPQRA